MAGQFGQREGKVIWHADVFSEEYLPPDLIGREEERHRLRVCVSPMLRGQPPLNAWLFGPPGTGKTALARAVVRETCGSVASRFGFYVNCWERRSLYAVLQAMADSLKVLGGDAQDTNVKLDRVKQITRGRPIVVILDDIDRVSPSEREQIIMGLLTGLKTGLVCISGLKETFQSLGEGTRSRLSPVMIEFQPYRVSEVEQILFARAWDGLMPNSWTGATLGEIARVAGGDARGAIRSLQAAAVAAEATGRNQIGDGNLLASRVGQEETRPKQLIRRLSHHERLIYDLALRHAPIQTTALRRSYDALCEKQGIVPVARRTFSKYVKLLGDARLLRVDNRALAGKGRLVRRA